MGSSSTNTTSSPACTSLPMASAGPGAPDSAGASEEDEEDSNHAARSTAASGVGAGSSEGWNAVSRGGGSPRALACHRSRIQNSTGTPRTISMPYR